MYWPQVRIKQTKLARCPNPVRPFENLLRITFLICIDEIKNISERICYGTATPTLLMYNYLCGLTTKFPDAVHYTIKIIRLDKQTSMTVPIIFLSPFVHFQHQTPKVIVLKSVGLSVKSSYHLKTYGLFVESCTGFVV